MDAATAAASPPRGASLPAAADADQSTDEQPRTQPASCVLSGGVQDSAQPEPRAARVSAALLAAAPQEPDGALTASRCAHRTEHAHWTTVSR